MLVRGGGVPSCAQGTPVGVLDVQGYLVQKERFLSQPSVFMGEWFFIFKSVSKPFIYAFLDEPERATDYSHIACTL